MKIDNELRKHLLSFSISGKKEPTAYCVYSYILLTANHRQNCVNGIAIERGQCLTSFRKISENTGISEQSVRTAVKKLVNSKYITQHSTNHYTIFTVCKYDATDAKEKGADTSKIKKPGNSKYVSEKSKEEKQSNAELVELIAKKLDRNEYVSEEEKQIFNEYHSQI